jgi:cytochrome P450
MDREPHDVMDNAAANFDFRRLPDDFLDDPFPYYRALRECDPVKTLPDGTFFLSRHGDVLACYRDCGSFSSDKRREFLPKFGGKSRLYRHHTTSLVFNDAPYHTRVRRSILGALVPKALAPIGRKLKDLVNRLLDRAEASCEFDAIGDFAAAIPVNVIGDLLGIPDGDRGPLRNWSLAILGGLEPVLAPAALDRGEQALGEFHDYLSELIADRRRHPRDPASDVLTRLIQSDGEPLSEIELSENCVFLLNAGHETTTNLIGNAIELLARFPEQRKRLVKDPELLRPAIEEVLRFESPNQLGNRVTTGAVTIGGKPVPAGSFIVLGIGAANRDPEAFADPEAFDIARNPNRHVAFAAGVHQCAGMNLARMEAQIALEALVSRFPGYTLTGKPVRTGRVRFRGFSAMRVRCR